MPDYLDDILWEVIYQSLDALPVEDEGIGLDTHLQSRRTRTSRPARPQSFQQPFNDALLNSPIAVKDSEANLQISPQVLDPVEKSVFEEVSKIVQQAPRVEEGSLQPARPSISYDRPVTDAYNAIDPEYSTFDVKTQSQRRKVSRWL